MPHVHAQLTSSKAHDNLLVKVARTRSRLSTSSATDLPDVISGGELRAMLT